MKKQKVSLKKLNLSKSKVASVNSNHVVGGYLFFLTDNGCGSEYSVWPDICPISHNCPPAHTDGCPPNPNTSDCNLSFDCQTVVGCTTVGTPTFAC
ncbi:hypothetical protein [uncultured Kordia sp.]|uniref:hypothetical protein n=1 Tax=uncultured Kordia sp. TaxID=507699 RepID=UPI0026108EEA|nr:hypothetical protein [uncultured Kordia sp.]